MTYQPHRHPEEAILKTFFDIFHLQYRPTMTTITTSTIASCTTIVDHDIIYPVIDKLYRTKKPNFTSLKIYKKLHLTTLHLSKRTLETMVKAGTLLDMPNDIIDGMNKFQCDCFQCMLHQTKLLNKGPKQHTNAIPPFTILHFDFQFFGIASIRGFTSSLAIVCGSTSYPFNFPTKSKAPPIDILGYVLRSIRTMGFNPIYCHMDEDGALARSSEFCKAIIDEGCILRTTGGGNSTNNGMVESGNGFDIDLIRPTLGTMHLMFGKQLPQDLPIQNFWCCALQMVTVLRRRLYNRNRKDCPYYLIHGKRPSFKELVIPGSLMTIVKPNKNALPRFAPDRITKGYFCGFGNNCRICLYWSPQPSYSFQRSYHSVIEDTATFSILDPLVFATAIDKSVTTNLPSTSATSQPAISATFQASMNEGNNLNIIKSGFPDRPVTSITVQLPSNGILGIELSDDKLYNLPFISKCRKDSFWYNNVPPNFRRNVFIIGFNDDQPITSHYLQQSIHDKQQSSDTKTRFFYFPLNNSRN